jgi:ferredoxin-NADP reductase
MYLTKYTIKDIFKTGEDVVIINVSPVKGDVFKYKPGQYAMLSPYDKNGYQMSSRPFSIASSPTQNNYLQFGIKIMGKFTKRLSELKIGDKINVYGPYGDFTYSEKKYPDSIFIAGGIGITPFINSIRYSNNKRNSQHITLLYSNRKLNTTVFKDELEDISRENKNIKTILSITDENISKLEKNIENRRIDREMISKYSEPIKNKTFFICGPEKFMEAMERKLLSLGVKKKNIKYEIFSVDKPIGKYKNIRNSILVYVGSLIVFILFLSSISNTKSINTQVNTVERIPTNNTTSSTNNRNLTYINNIAITRKDNINNIQKQYTQTAKNETIQRQLKFQENIFKQDTSRGQVPSSSVSPTQQNTQPATTYIPQKIRKVLPRTTVS